MDTTTATATELIDRARNLANNANKIMEIDQKLIARFFSKVEKTEGCWLWTSYRNKMGYGKFTIGRKIYYSHRISWEIENGDIPRRTSVCHHCDNTSCVNPNHLFIGTQSDNLKDSSMKGRTSRGQHRPLSKITDEVASKIRSEHAFGALQIHLCDKYHLSKTTIHNLVNRKTYKHIP